MSVEERRADVGTVDGVVAAGGPATAARDQAGVIDFPNGDGSGGELDFGMALEAKVVIAFGEERAVDRAVGRVTNRAAFAESFVFEDVGAGLFAMAIGASFIQPGHGQGRAFGVRRLENVVAVWVVAAHAIESILNDRVMLRQVEFGVDVLVAIETDVGVFAWIDDELAAPAADAHVFAGWSVAGFAAAHTRELDVIFAEAAVSAVRK